MVDLREDLRQQDRIAEALQAHSKEELVDMMSQLIKTYVIDGTQPIKPEVGKVHVPQTLRGLDFPSLVETLKFHLDIPDLEKFNVVDGEVYVKLGEREYALSGPAPLPQLRQTAPVAPPPTAAAPPAVDLPPAPASPMSGDPPPRKRPQAGPTPADDRFRMLELD